MVFLGLATVASEALVNFSSPRPKTEESALLDETRRISYIAPTEKLPAGVKIFDGYSEAGGDYIFMRGSAEPQIYFIDSVEMLEEKDLYRGHLPADASGVVLGSANPDEALLDAELGGLKNNLALPESYMVCGLVKLPSRMSDTIFVRPELFKLTSDYQVIKKELHIQGLEQGDYRLVLDSGVALDTIATNRLTGGTVQVKLRRNSRAFTVSRISASDGVHINPASFDLSEIRGYQTAVFKSYQAKKSYVDTHDFYAIYDRFSERDNPVLFSGAHGASSGYFIVIPPLLTIIFMIICCFQRSAIWQMSEDLKKGERGKLKLHIFALSAAAIAIALYLLSGLPGLNSVFGTFNPFLLLYLLVMESMLYLTVILIARFGYEKKES